MITYGEWENDRENQRRLKDVVDRISLRVSEGGIADRAELEIEIEKARQLCGRLFPDKLDHFDRVYGSRLTRLWEQFGSHIDRED